MKPQSRVPKHTVNVAAEKKAKDSVEGARKAKAAAAAAPKPAAAEKPLPAPKPPALKPAAAVSKPAPPVRRERPPLQQRVALVEGKGAPVEPCVVFPWNVNGKVRSKSAQAPADDRVWSPADNLEAVQAEVLRLRPAFDDGARRGGQRQRRSHGPQKRPCWSL